MKDFFSQIANKENGKLLIIDEPVKQYNGAHYYKYCFELSIPYQDTTIKIDNSLSPNPFGIYRAELNLKNQCFKFELDTKSQFRTYLSLNKTRIKLKCKNGNLKDFLKSDKSIKRIEEIIETTQFEPLITGRYENDKYIITSEYHMLMTDKTMVIEPMIEFFKSIIDKLLIEDKYPLH